MMSTPDDSATITVYDGMDSRGNLLATISVRNETWPQSLTSTREYIYVEFKANKSSKVLVYFDLVAGKSKDN